MCWNSTWIRSNNPTRDVSNSYREIVHTCVFCQVDAEGGGKAAVRQLLFTVGQFCDPDDSSVFWRVFYGATRTLFRTSNTDIGADPTNPGIRVHTVPGGGHAEETTPFPTRTLSIAYPHDTPPFFFRDSFGAPRGLVIDFWTLWSEKSGIAIESVPGTWQETLEWLREGKVDIWELRAAKTGQKIEFRPSSWPETLNALKEGRADIHAGLFLTQERAE
jgi:ABC-type amino acid transport substrate-binding protein